MFLATGCATNEQILYLSLSPSRNTIILLSREDHASYYRQCAKCGHTSKANRPNKGLLFHCECCDFELHADLVGSRNIALRALLIRQDWMSTGILSASPDVSSDETSSGILQRFSELRWSLDTSPHGICEAEGSQISGG
uniref:transposase n=1 Tax=Aerosakkonema funiforme TaxID=1246630 RepID=UPI001F55204D|nr:transposase [Aerosakkonema funiforme]